jgi:hypothetical protein
VNDKNKISFKWYVGQGPQVAPTVSLLFPYYEVAPMHVQNYSLTYNMVITPRITNQIFAGVNYFNQAFSDESTAYDPIALGLNTGVTSPTLAGSPRIQIAAPSASSGLGSSANGFDYVGATVNSGRNDITGHLDESLSWTVGKHQFHFGGEFRQAQIDDFYQADQRGTFVFDGSQGPWTVLVNPQNTPGAACSALSTVTPSQKTIDTLKSTYGGDDRFFELADFLAGCFNPSDTTIVQGNPKRQVFLNSYGIYAQDTFQVTPTLNVNYGLRYEYSGPLHAAAPDLSTFLPGAPNGLAVVGENLSSLYPQYYAGWGPRVGVTWQPGHDSKTVVRAGWGLGYDNPNVVNFLNSRFSSNGGAFGVQDNPAGPASLQAVDTGAAVGVIPSGSSFGAPIFPNDVGAANPCLSSTAVAGCQVNLFSVSQKLRPGYLENYNLNIQRSLGSKAVAQIGYVGSAGHRLRDLVDINQAGLGSLFAPVPYTGVGPTGISAAQCPPAASGATPSTPGNDFQCSRPYFSQYPNYSVINQVQSEANSAYNGLQATLRLSSWHGLTSQFAYTYAHALDESSEVYLYNPQNSLCLRCEWGNSDFDVRNTYTNYITYMAPAIPHLLKAIGEGWQFNALLSFHGGQPFTVFSSNGGGSGTGEYAERANEVPGANPNAGISKNVQGNATSGYFVNWTPTSFTPSANGAFGDSERNDLHGPGFSDVDFSVFKNTKITERISAQFRVEMFNLFNRLNLAAPGDGFCTDTGNGQYPDACAIGATIGANYGAPGIGPGEPFNTQLALKIIF